MEMWRSYAPGGREVMIRREGGRWKVTCGRSRAESSYLDVALTQALRADADVTARVRDIEAWIRAHARLIDPGDGTSA